MSIEFLSSMCSLARAWAGKIMFSTPPGGDFGDIAALGWGSGFPRQTLEREFEGKV
jgi:hypothetical protein